MAVADSTIKDLRAKRAQLAGEAAALLTKAVAEHRAGTRASDELTAEESASFEAAHADIERLGKSIERHERQRDVDAHLRESAGTIAGPQSADPEAQPDEPEGEAPEPGSPEEFERALAFAAKKRGQVFCPEMRAFARGGIRAFSPEKRAAMQARVQAMAQTSPEIRALSAQADTAGAYLVPEGYYTELQVAQKLYGGMLQAGYSFDTDSGQPLPVPTTDDTSNEGAILGENTTVGQQDVVFGRVMFNAYMYTSKIVLVPVQLLDDSAFNIEAFLMSIFGMRLGRIQNRHYTLADAQAKPNGLLNAATAGVTAASATAISYKSDLLPLKHSVDPAYWQGSNWMFNSDTLLKAKQLVDGQGRPLWSSGIAIKAPDTIDGDSYVMNQNMPSVATGQKSIVYGLLSKYWIRNVRGTMVVRFGERYMDNLQVGFMAFERHDGNLVDAGTHPVKYLVHP